MKVAFLDRDGVINKEIGYLHRVDDFEYTENCVPALRNLSSLGYELIIVTNQAGIAKGLYTERDYQALTEWLVSDLKASGVDLLDVFYCPHHPNGKVTAYSRPCSCRKPQPGMFYLARDKHGIDTSNSIVVGDKHSDILAGRKANIGRAFLVKSGHAFIENTQLDAEIYANLYEVSMHLLRERAWNKSLR